MNNRREYLCRDGKSIFRVENNGRIRLILKPEERVVLTGNLNDQTKILLLFKSKADYLRKSFTLGVPQELWDNEQQGIKTVAIHVRETNEYLCTTAAEINMFGYTDEEHTQHHRHSYVFLDREHWTAVGNDLEAVQDFLLTKKAQQGGQNAEK